MRFSVVFIFKNCSQVGAGFRMLFGISELTIINERMGP